MRTAGEFNQFYFRPDPWDISRAKVRNNALQRWLGALVKDKSVLELGSGEGFLTERLFGDCKSVLGIDISNVAIERASAKNLKNATFKQTDFIECSFEGFDIITAIDCLYYLKPEEQERFFQKVAKEHAGKLLIISGPIIGQSDQNNYFTHKKLLRTFNTFGFILRGFRNLSVYWHPLPSHFVANIVKLPFGHLVLDRLPVSMIYQRLYMAFVPHDLLPSGVQPTERAD